MTYASSSKYTRSVRCASTTYCSVCVSYGAPLQLEELVWAATAAAAATQLQQPCSAVGHHVPCRGETKRWSAIIEMLSSLSSASCPDIRSPKTLPLSGRF